MTRLFIRFYLGVLFILFCAWSIQGFVSRQSRDVANVQVIEEALGGGIRVATARMIDTAVQHRSAVVQDLQKQFDYPVQIVSGEEIPKHARNRFTRGDEVVLIAKAGAAYVVAPLSDGAEALRFGPLPSFVGPSQTELMSGLGLVLLLAAGAIALILQPVAKQLRLVERTATAIAGGDFSARVDERKVNSATTLARAFNNMASRTETMLRTQRELLQAVSHELRTPLSRIHFAIDLIRESNDEAQREERLCALENSAQELDDLVRELLQYVRLESSEPEIDCSIIELRPLFKELIEKYSLVNPSISFAIGEEIRSHGFAICADGISLERALGNLLANAGRFAKRRVEIDAHKTADATVIHVDDDGPGISESDRTRVFDPFVRLDESGGGAGLGLALVRRIAESHGGSVSALPSPMGGCRICSTWPDRELDKDEVPTGA